MRHDSASASAFDQKYIVSYVLGNERDAFFFSESLRILSKSHAHERREIVKVLRSIEIERACDLSQNVQMWVQKVIKF